MGFLFTPSGNIIGCFYFFSYLSTPPGESRKIIDSKKVPAGKGYVTSKKCKGSCLFFFTWMFCNLVCGSMYLGSNTVRKGDLTS